MVMMKDYNIQSVHIVKTISQLLKPKVVPFMGKIECKK